MKRVRIISLGLVCLLVMAVLSCERRETSPKELPEEKAAGFVLNDINGQSVELDDFIGKKIILLTFFTTWCPHCRQQIPELNAVKNEYKDVEVISIDIQESEKKLRSFIDEYKINYTVLMDKDSKVAKEYNVLGIPHVVIIDRKGKIRFRGVQPQGGFKKFIDRLM
ncbi:MAG: TlpA disulfide reductase family protein [Candidatus Omnitrophota bacterium]